MFKVGTIERAGGRKCTPGPEIATAVRLWRLIRGRLELGGPLHPFYRGLTSYSCAIVTMNVYSRNIAAANSATKPSVAHNQCGRILQSPATPHAIAGAAMSGVNARLSIASRATHGDRPQVDAAVSEANCPARPSTSAGGYAPDESARQGSATFDGGRFGNPSL